MAFGWVNLCPNNLCPTSDYWVDLLTSFVPNIWLLQWSAMDYPPVELFQLVARLARPADGFGALEIGLARLGSWKWQNMWHHPSWPKLATINLFWIVFILIGAQQNEKKKVYWKSNWAVNTICNYFLSSIPHNWTWKPKKNKKKNIRQLPNVNFIGDIFWRMLIRWYPEQWVQVLPWSISWFEIWSLNHHLWVSKMAPKKSGYQGGSLIS